jgi:glycosyltransferase involved in cell wall biosynthesis
VYTYTYALLRHLPALDPGIEYVALIDQAQADEGRLSVKSVDQIVVPIMNPLQLLIWSHTSLPRLLESRQIDVYHGLKHFGLRRPRNYPSRMIWTLHSASWWLFPELFSRKERLFWSNYYSIGARTLDQVVCVSHADKRAFVDAVGLEPDHVSVTQLAANPRFYRDDDPNALESVRRKLRLPEKYVLFVGTIYPFKNLDTVLAVYARAVEKAGLPHSLVIAGGTSPAYGEKYLASLKAQAVALGIEDRVLWIGSVFDELPAVYSMADVLIFPSRFEAFPQPPLEAMACDVPVVTSNQAGLPEVVGDAGLMRDPHDVAGLAEDVIRAITDEQTRANLIAKGRARVDRFSWDRCAADTVETYHKVLRAS